MQTVAIPVVLMLLLCRLVSAKMASSKRLPGIGEGCTISRAAASYVTGMVQGLNAEEIENITFEDLVSQLGREVVMTRPTCATLALGTLKRGVHEYDMHQRADKAHYPDLQK